MIYAYAALQTGTPYANGAPNFSVGYPGAVQLAQKNKVPITGKDFKTGQTLMKTVIAPGLKARMLGVKRLVFDEHTRESRRRSSG